MSSPPTRRLVDWDEPVTRTHEQEGDAQQAVERLYLVVFQGSSSSMFPLPTSGQVLIGRSEKADLVLAESGVSRRHARIEVYRGEARIIDLESQNGTFVNGQRIVSAAIVSSGDLIGICGTTLVFHASLRASPARRLLSYDEFRGRLEEELERAFRYGRVLSLIAIDCGGAEPDPIAQTVAASLRLIDVVGWGSGRELLILVPEMDADHASAGASRLLETVQAESPAAKVGFATFPGDGCDAASLLAGARAALQNAEAGRVAPAAAACQMLSIGDQKLVVVDPAMGRLFSLVERLSTAELPVLICGETGTGKELVAKALHAWSARKLRPLVTLNCAALQETLLESELFGYEKGAFSGAVGSKPGMLETGDGGTVFLDEIGEMPAAAQAKLLRVLETKRVQRLGDIREREINIRVVAATNRNLESEVKAGRFRKDLFFRLSGAQLWLPPLRDRQRELPVLAQTLLHEACERARRPPMAISNEAVQVLARYSWPGNVRELKNVMEYVVAAAPGPLLEPRHLTERLSQRSESSEDIAAEFTPIPTAAFDRSQTVQGSQEEGGPFQSLEEEMRMLEKKRMTEALAATTGNQTRAAKLIGMPLRTFVTKLKQYGLHK